MIKSFATLGVLAVTGVLSICTLCGPRARAAVVSPSRTAAAATTAVGAPVATSAAAQPQAEVRTVTLAVQGMTCGGCVIGTRTVLGRLPGVTKADVSYKDKKGRAVVTYDSARVTVAQMVAAVKTLGYTATIAR